MSKQQEKISGCRALVIGMNHRQQMKTAFDWTRLIPWIPGINDIRRRGTQAEMQSPAHRQTVHDKLAPIYKQEDLERALGTGRANVVRHAGAGSANL